MISVPRYATTAFAALLVILFLTCLGRAAEPAATAAAPATQPTQQQIMSDLNAGAAELGALFTSPQDIFDEAKRTQVAPKAIPPMRRMVAALEALMHSDPDARARVAPTRLQFLTLLSLMGDAQATQTLEKEAASQDKSVSLAAKGAQLLVRWWKSSNAADAQSRVLDEMQALAKANPTSDELTQSIMVMSQQGAANNELIERAEKIILEDLKSESAKELATQIEAERMLKALQGKPLTIAGATVDGKQFSTEAWKGKVILVDFWATWCGPCLQELPRVKKAYADFHDKGLEIVGVSCDRSEEALKKFLAENKDMPWPQLFDATRPGWHALATQFGITGIPTMFLIDKKGVVRTVEARENFEELIPKMLAEPPQP